MKGAHHWPLSGNLFLFWNLLILGGSGTFHRSWSSRRSSFCWFSRKAQSLPNSLVTTYIVLARAVPSPTGHSDRLVHSFQIPRNLHKNYFGERVSLSHQTRTDSVPLTLSRHLKGCAVVARSDTDGISTYRGANFIARTSRRLQDAAQYLPGPCVRVGECVFFPGLIIAGCIAYYSWMHGVDKCNNIHSLQIQPPRRHSSFKVLSPEFEVGFGSVISNEMKRQVLTGRKWAF